MQAYEQFMRAHLKERERFNPDWKQWENSNPRFRKDHQLTIIPETVPKQKLPLRTAYNSMYRKQYAVDQVEYRVRPGVMSYLYPRQHPRSAILYDHLDIEIKGFWSGTFILDISLIAKVFPSLRGPLEVHTQQERLQVQRAIFDYLVKTGEIPVAMEEVI